MQAARSSGAPACGQRLSKAKNSPLAWNTTTSRPSRVITLLPPGGRSVVRAMANDQCLRSEFVDSAGVGLENLDPFRLAERRLESKARIVEIPMRIVRRKQQAIDADPFHQRAQMLRFIRLVHRLRGEPEMLPHIFRGLALEMRHFGAEAFEVLIHPPHRR